MQNINKTILVTGSSRGIGFAIAKRLARDGFNLVLHCKSSMTKAVEAANEIRTSGRKARVLQFDTINRKQCRAVLEADIEANGAYYGVVCNAGIVRDNAFPVLSDDDWDQVIRTNLDGFYNVLQPVIMPMIHRRKPGRIVTLSSVSGEIGNRGQVNYSASKAGVIGATKALAVELAKRNITVNCVSPGLIGTKMTDGLPIEEILKVIPMQRVGTPEEVAGAVSYLCSADAGYVTRQVLSVNGGIF